MIRRKNGIGAIVVAMLITPSLTLGQETKNAESETGAGESESAMAPSATTRVPASADAVGVSEPSASHPSNEEKLVQDDDTFDSMVGRPGGLTSDEAARQASEYSPDAQVAREDYEYAKARKMETIYNYLPRLTLTASYTRQSVPGIYRNMSMGNLVGTTAPAGPLGPTDPLYAVDGSAFNFSPLYNNWFLNAGLVIPLSDYALNFASALKGANAATKAAELNEEAAKLNAGANARLRYYEWVRAKLRVRETKKALVRAQAQLENLRVLQGGGRVARADVLRQEAFVSSSELEVRRADTNEAIARQSLHELMNGGEEATPNWEIGEDIMAPQRRVEADVSEIQELQRQAVENRLEVQAMEQSAAALDDQSAVFRSQGYPRVEAFGNVTYANPNARYIPPQNEWNWSWDVGVRATWTVNDLGVKQSAARSSDAEAAKVRAQRRQMIDALRSEVLASYRTVQEASLARESARRGVLAAEAAHEDRLRLFQAGRGTTLDVLQAETSLVSAKMDLIDAHIILREAQVRLDHAVGRDIQGTSNKN